MRQVVWSHKPYLKLLVREKGSFSIFDYFQATSEQRLAHNQERQKDCLAVIEAEATAWLGADVARQAVEALRYNYFVSTTDHHEPLSHPFFLGNNLVQSFVEHEAGRNTMVVLACAGVSLNNSSFPRGLFFHDEELTTRRLPFFSLKHRRSPVFAMPAYKGEAIERLQRTCAPSSALRDILNMYRQPEVLTLPSYSAQISRTNHVLWKRIPGQEHTNLVYLSLEDIASRLIVQHHLWGGSLIQHLLFGPTFHAAFSQHFVDIPGMFSKNHKSGTFLFWGIKNGERVMLVHDGAQLRSIDGTYTIALTPDAVGEALVKRTLMPSYGLALLIISFYYGITCGGGFSQINYLTYMKEAYLRLLHDVGAGDEEHAAVDAVDTQVFRGEFVIVSLGAQRGQPVPATALDCILYAHKDSAEVFERMAREMSLADAVDSMMHEFYKIVTGKGAQYVNTLHGKPTLRTA